MNYLGRRLDCRLFAGISLPHIVFEYRGMDYRRKRIPVRSFYASLVPSTRGPVSPGFGSAFGVY